MNYLASWNPWGMAFLVAFALAALSSGAIYWLAHYPSKAIWGAKKAPALFLLCALLFFFIVALSGHFLGRALIFVLITLGVSGLQALLERNLERETWAITPHLVRSFSAYLVSAAFLCVLGGFLATMPGGFIVPSVPTSIPLWVVELYNTLYNLIVHPPPTSISLPTSTSLLALTFSTAFCGMVGGWLLTPLSISFYRFLFQNIKLRPGIDRPLRDSELSG